MRRFFMVVLVLFGVSAVVLFAACSKDKKNPTGPGGPLSISLAAGGGSGSFTFNTAGTYGYHCSIHAEMHGNQVIVDAGSVVDSVVVSVIGITTPGFSPTPATVRVGGKVRWDNGTVIDHTVTSD